MIFHSRFLDHVPFSTLSSNRYTQNALTLAERAEERLRFRIAPPEKLMYRGGSDKVFDLRTGKFFTGKVRYDNGDKFVRTISFVNGSEKFSLITDKSGKKYYAEIVGGKSKKFDTGLSPQEISEQTDKLLKADEDFFGQLMANFRKRKIFTIKK